MIKGVYILESLIMEYDIHIKNGEIIDGTGAPKFKSDIVIDKGKIIGIFPPENGDIRDDSEKHFLSNFKAKQTFDAKNKIISPGFIDVHTHDDDNVFLLFPQFSLPAHL